MHACFKKKKKRKRKHFHPYRDICAVSKKSEALAASGGLKFIKDGSEVSKIQCISARSLAATAAGVVFISSVGSAGDGAARMHQCRSSNKIDRPVSFQQLLQCK